MAKSMEGKVALVTGGAAGIGRACALAFGREGAHVVVADTDARGGEETVRHVENNGAKAVFVRTDVSAMGEVESLVHQAVQAYGRLDYGCNNAGIEGTTATTADCTPENWERTIAVNLKGVWLCMKFEIPQMQRQGGGAIVNMSSVAGLVGFPGLPAYVASKHGIVGLTKTAALEYATQSIRVNAICPGVIRTAMIDRLTGGNPEVEAQFTALQPVGRMGTPEEIAAAVVWLCSDAASFVTGQAIAVDGGFVAR